MGGDTGGGGGFSLPIPTMNDIFGENGGLPGLPQGGGLGPWSFLDPGHIVPKEQVDTAGKRPSRIGDFSGIANKNGALLSPYRVSTGADVKAGKVLTNDVRDQQINLKDKNLNDTRAQDALLGRATSNKDSAWLTGQNKKLGIEERAARGQASRQALSGSALARSQLAMQGGLSSGARERLAMQGSRDLNAARQASGQQGQLNRLNASISDEQMKQGLLGQAVNTETARVGQKQDLAKVNAANALAESQANAANALAASQNNASLGLNAQQFNATQDMGASAANAAAAIQGQQDRNKYNLGKYSEDMKGWAAAKTADGTTNAGKK